MTDLRWYALWTRSRHESVVRQGLNALAIETFLPTITSWSHWKDRKKQIDRPLFPGYCFARFEPDSSLSVLKQRGVVNIVSFNGQPSPIPDIEITSVRQLIDSALQYDPCPMIHEEAMVEVVHGPLTGVVGRRARIPVRDSSSRSISSARPSVSKSTQPT